jgi:hypothetical protein
MRKVPSFVHSTLKVHRACSANVTRGPAVGEVSGVVVGADEVIVTGGGEVSREWRPDDREHLKSLTAKKFEPVV